MFEFVFPFCKSWAVGLFHVCRFYPKKAAACAGPGQKCRQPVLVKFLAPALWILDFGFGVLDFGTWAWDS